MIVSDIKTSNNRLIKAYQDIFTYQERTDFYDFISSSLFLTNGTDSYRTEVDYQIYSNYSKQDVENMGFFSTEGYKALDKEYNLSKREVCKYRVNLSPPFEKCFIHTDNCDITLLYYVNLNWKIENGGHTIFLDDNAKEPLYTSLYEPGKLVIFEGNIPHLIMPFNSIEYGNRKTFVIQYAKL